VFHYFFVHIASLQPGTGVVPEEARKAVDQVALHQEKDERPELQNAFSMHFAERA